MSAIDGLISGMATSDVIRQLMALERQPVVRLQSKKSMADKAITALQGLNTKFLALADLAKKLAATGWTAGGTTSSHPDILVAQAAAGTPATSLTVTVNSIATAHKVLSTDTYVTTADKVSNGGPITISYLDTNGATSTFSVTPASGSMNDIVAAVNGASTSPVTAAAVQNADGTYSLQFTAKRTGAFSAFDVTIVRPNGKNMVFGVTAKAADTSVTVGSGDFATTITSQSTTVEVADGISVSVLKADPATAVTVTVTEASKPADDVQKLIDSANEILKEIKTLTAYDPLTKKAGSLQGNRTLRDLQNAILTTVATAVGGVSPGTVGVELTREGTLAFDKVKFDTAYAADPVGVYALFSNGNGDGLAQRLQALSDSATKFSTGTLTQAIDARRAEVKRIDDSIAVWDVRLARKEAALRKQFAALESALGAMQQQGNWLAGQISSLPTWSTE